MLYAFPAPCVPSEIGQVQRQTSTCRIALANEPTSCWLTAAANSRSVSAAGSRVAFWPIDRPTDQPKAHVHTHTHPGGIILTPMCRVQLSSPRQEQAGREPGSGGLPRRVHHEGRKQYHSPPSRATLAGHRPMPCHGAVNASVTSDKKQRACGSSAGHPNSCRVNVVHNASGKHAAAADQSTSQSKASHHAVNWSASDHR